MNEELKRKSEIFGIICSKVDIAPRDDKELLNKFEVIAEMTNVVYHILEHSLTKNINKL